MRRVIHDCTVNREVIESRTYGVVARCAYIKDQVKRNVGVRHRLIFKKIVELGKRQNIGGACQRSSSISACVERIDVGFRSSERDLVRADLTSNTKRAPPTRLRDYSSTSRESKGRTNSTLGLNAHKMYIRMND